MITTVTAVHRFSKEDAIVLQGTVQNKTPMGERAVHALNRTFPKVEFSTWPFCERLLPQVHAISALINQWGFEFPEAAQLLNAAGSYLFERGRYSDTKPLLERALAIWEKALGPGNQM